MKNKNSIISKLFFSLLPVQILIFAMSSINSIVDGAMAGQFVGATAVGIIGMYYVVTQLITAISNVLLGGTTVVCGRFMGKGEMKKTQGIFSLNITVTFIIGAILTALSFLIPGPIADLAGASEELKPELMNYINGCGYGIIPMMLAMQIAAFLQMERESKRGYIGVIAMILTNSALDYVFAAVMGLGIWGIALATSVGNLVYLLVLISYYLTDRAQLKYNIKNILWSSLPDIIKIGFPGALLVFCLSFRGMVLNRILLTYSGNDGLSALSAFNMVLGLLIAYCLGFGSVVRMLVSVFVGEEDKNSLKATMKITITRGLLLSVIIGAIVALLSPFISSIFFTDKASNVYRLNHQLILIYCACLPMVLFLQVMTNYFQAMDHRLFVNINSIIDGFFSMVIPSLILAPFLGAFGVWLANPIGIFLTILTIPVYACFFWKRAPKTVDEWLFLRPDFGVSEDKMLSIQLNNMDDVTMSSERIQQFCAENGLVKKTAYYAALCLEEMAGNVITHGFSHDNKNHSLTSVAVFKKDTVILRIKDDCVPFNPGELAAMTSDENNINNIGIRMVYDIASDVSYQNMLGLNVLTITLSEANLLEQEENDYLLEKALKAKDPDLHQRFRNIVFATQKVLTKYKQIFPEYTDHSEFHSLTVIDSCNRIIGPAQINMLNADEIFILLSACYFHDVGMGISENDYEEFKNYLGVGKYFDENPEATKADFVRTYHHEFSALFIEKYADFFEIPTVQHVFAIKQIVRGHRKTDLFSENEYPAKLQLANGNTVCLPYLAALIRISDEIDVVATRNPLVLFDIDELTDPVEIVENKKLMAVKSMVMTDSAFILSYNTDDAAIEADLTAMVSKMQRTLDYCRDVTENRTQFHIRQRKIILKKL